MGTESDKPNVLPVNPGEPYAGEETFVFAPRLGANTQGFQDAFGQFNLPAPTGASAQNPNGVGADGKPNSFATPESTRLEKWWDEWVPAPIKKVMGLLNTDVSDLIGLDPEGFLGKVVDVAAAYVVGGPTGALVELADVTGVDDWADGLLDNLFQGDPKGNFKDIKLDNLGLPGGKEGYDDFLTGNPDNPVVQRALTWQENAQLAGGVPALYNQQPSTQVSTAGNQTVQTAGSDGVVQPKQFPGPPRPSSRVPEIQRPDYGVPDFNSGMDAGLLTQAYNNAAGGELQRPSILPAANSGQPSWQQYTDRYSDASYGGQSALLGSQQTGGLLSTPTQTPAQNVPQQWGDGTATQAQRDAFWGGAVQQNPDAFDQQQKKDIWYNLATRQGGGQSNQPQDLGGLTTGASGPNPNFSRPDGLDFGLGGIRTDQHVDLSGGQQSNQQIYAANQAQPRTWNDGTATEAEKAAFMGLLGRASQNGGLI